MPLEDQPIQTDHDQPQTIARECETDDFDRYPAEAFQFVQQGLGFTAERQFRQQPVSPDVTHHVTGQQLAAGLREFALLRWGLMARTVLKRWRINSTMDFGRIVFAMIERGLMSKTSRDTIEDFREVYRFDGFDAGYQIPCEPPIGSAQVRP